MNRPATSIGLLLALVGTFLFYGVFVGITPGFTAFLTALILLPIGSGILFYGAAYSGSYSARPAVGGGGGGASSGTVYAALGVAVIAVLIALASLSMALTAQSSAGNSSAVTSLNSNVSAVNSALSKLGVQPSTVAFKVDWCNTDNTGEDRFCPNELVVNQGDVVQIMFMHNDTDVHTFTLDTSPYILQINDSAAGMHNFITNGNLAGACTNGTFAQESAGLSGVYCVSGTSLLAPSGNFRIAQNPTPASPGGSGGLSLIDIKMDNTVHVVNFNFTSGASEVWGVGSFQATQPGIYEFFCHYHVSNGMFGYLIVLPNAYCSSNAAACGIQA